MILLDTSILIDYYRKTDKTKTVLLTLLHQGHTFAVSIVTKYEIYSGATPNQVAFWNQSFQSISVLPFDENCVDAAIHINTDIKRKSKQIAIADLFIASTAVAHQLSIATLNKKHFERINELEIIE